MQACSTGRGPNSRRKLEYCFIDDMASSMHIMMLAETLSHMDQHRLSVSDNGNGYDAMSCRLAISVSDAEDSGQHDEAM